MESNRSGQSYQSGYRGRQEGGSGIKRTPEGDNPFRKAQRLYHMELTPPPLAPATSEDDQAPSHFFFFIGRGIQ